MGNGLASGGGFLLLARDFLFVDQFMDHERPMHNADVLMFALQHHVLDVVGYDKLSLAFGFLFPNNIL